MDLWGRMMADSSWLTYGPTQWIDYEWRQLAISSCALYHAWVITLRTSSCSAYVQMTSATMWHHMMWHLATPPNSDIVLSHGYDNGTPRKITWKLGPSSTPHATQQPQSWSKGISPFQHHSKVKCKRILKEVCNCLCYGRTSFWRLLTWW
jgi:hypothetical protein